MKSLTPEEIKAKALAIVGPGDFAWKSRNDLTQKE
jgi:hypothetical protein